MSGTLASAQAANQGVQALAGLFQSTPGQAVPTWEKLVQDMLQQSSQNTSSEAQISEILEAIQQQITTTTEQTTQNQSGTTTTQNLSDAQQAQLNDLITNLSSQLGGDNPYSIEKAQEAAQGSMEASIQQVLRSGIGDVAASGANMGAYNSTVQGKAASRLGADAASAGAKAQLDAINNFAGLGLSRDANLANTISNLFNTATNAGSTTTSDQNLTSDTTGSSTTDTTTSQNAATAQTGSETTEATTSTETTSETDRKYDEVGGRRSLMGSLGRALGF